MDPSFESFGERVGACIMDGSPIESSVIDTHGERRRSLSSGGGPFVSVAGEEYDWLESEINGNQGCGGNRVSE